jgi:hypothetical protein
MEPQGSVAGKGRFVVPKGIEVDSRIISVVLCPVEQVFAKGLTDSLAPVIRVYDYAAKNPCPFFLSYDIRIAQQFFLLVQIGE